MTRLPTGMPRLDALLGGGFLPGLALVLGDASDRMANQLATSVRQHRPSHLGGAACLSRSTLTADDAHRYLAIVRRNNGAAFVYAPDGTDIERGALNLIDAVMVLEGTTLHVTKNRGGGLGSVALRETDGGAFVEAEGDDVVSAPAEAPTRWASLYTPTLNPEFAAATDAAFREGEAHAWASAVRVADRYVGVFDDPEQVAIVDAILRDLRAVAKGRA